MKLSSYTNLKNEKISFSSFLCKDGLILYKIIRKNDANLYLEYIEEENYYQVICNKSISVELIKDYVLKNYEWIRNWYKNIENPQPWLIFGTQVPVKVLLDGTNNVDYLGSNIIVHLRHKRDYRDVVKNFYKKFATAYFLPRVQELIEKLKLKGMFGKATWSKHYYGLCHSNKTIDLSAKLIQYNKEFIDSVIYHEIAHFTYMNHRKPFWNLLDQYCPNHKQLDREALSFSFKNHLW